MKKKPVRKTKKRIIDFLEAIDWMFGINNYERDLVFMEEGDIVAKIFIEHDYQRIRIEIYPPFMKKSIQVQRKALLHELCHCIVSKSKAAMMGMLSGTLTPENICRDINEEETSRIENLLHSLLTGRLKYAKKAYKDYLDA